MNVTEIAEPTTQQQFEDYFELRWRVLRAPWQQPRGSEKDELENAAVHRMVVEQQQVIAVGRLHRVDEETAQVRYMAVDPAHENQGLGKQLLAALESYASKNRVTTIFLHARETVTGFYEKQGYHIVKPSHTLYNEIKHFLMEKKL